MQCRGCDAHRSIDPDEGPAGEWITVAEDYNQSPVYAQAGITAAVNYPQAAGKGKDVEWRARRLAAGGHCRACTSSSRQGPATTDGNTGGDAPPRQRAYDVANTDFFRDLDRHVVDNARGLRHGRPAAT